MSSTIDLYGKRREGKVHGDVFTSPDMVRFMLDLVGYTSDKDLSQVKILEPSFGSGEFLFEIQRRIKASSIVFGFNPVVAMTENVYACEIDEQKYRATVSLLALELDGFSPVNLKNEDFLMATFETDFDIIVGNPPYVRYENIPEVMRNIYKERFSCFHYRCDLYVLFYEHSLNMLANQGRHCFICSNRWLKNEYGKKLRALVSNSYSLDCIVDVENLDVFQESVLAYPAVTLISRHHSDKHTRIAVFKNCEDLRVPFNSIERLHIGEEDWDDLFLENTHEGLKTLEEQGFHIGIGVATGADHIFISEKFAEEDGIERELLLPIINARDLTGNEFHWKGRYLLNPYSKNGDMIQLDRFPKAKQYLESKRSDLEKRHIVKNRRVWYSLIDKVKYSLRAKPKILLPDISGNEVIFVDDGKYYPAHNIYYIIGGTKEKLTVVAAILMSDFVKSQIKTISNKMNGGMPRWQSRSIKKLRLPNIEGLSEDFINRVIEAYNNRDIQTINLAVGRLLNDYTLNGSKDVPVKIPKSIFEYDFSN